MFANKEEAAKYYAQLTRYQKDIVTITGEYEELAEGTGIRVSTRLRSSLVEHVIGIDIVFVNGRNYERVRFDMHDLVGESWTTDMIREMLARAYERICSV